MKEKILLVSCDGLGRGGVQAVMMSIVRNLSQKYQFDMLMFMDEYAYYAEEFQSYGGKIFVLPNYAGKNNFRKRADIYLRGLKRYFEIKRVLKENGPYKVVHCNNEYEAGLCLRAAKKNNIPIRISHVHVVISKLRFVRKVLNKFYLKFIVDNATQLLACSQMAGKSFYGEREDIKVIYNPFDSHKFIMQNSKEKKDNQLVLLQVGSYSDNKNQKFTIEIFNEVRKKYGDAKLYFVGFDVGTGYGESLKEYALNLGINENLFFCDWDTNIAELLEQTSYFLFPSRTEGFGIALVEAQAKGVKCFASDTVPKETNCGGCEYLPLSAGVELWTERILDDYEQTGGRHEYFDCSKFKEEIIMQDYQCLYK